MAYLDVSIAETAPSRLWTESPVKCPATNGSRGLCGLSNGDVCPKTTKLCYEKKSASTLNRNFTLRPTSYIWRRLNLATRKSYCRRPMLSSSRLPKRFFRVACNIAKMDRPYSDLPCHIDCYKSNGVDMGLVLHTDKSCAAIVYSIAYEMRDTLVK